MTDGVVGNASSPSRLGVEASRRLECARDGVASLVGADPGQIVFTSGCTEANNTVLRRALAGARRLVTTAVEHPSVSSVAVHLEELGVEVVRLRGLDGCVAPAELWRALERPTSLVSIQWANSETGVMQPIEEIARACYAANVPLHVDAAQAVGRVDVDFREIGADFLTFSGHKLHAPQGIGALCARDPDALEPLIRGGEQEGGMRAGTENVPGAAGMGAACAERADCLGEAAAHMRRLRDRLEAELPQAVPGTTINAGASPRVCNTSNVKFPVDGQAMVAHLDAAGVICSQTSACSSRSPEPSRILTELGLSREEAVKRRSKLTPHRHRKLTAGRRDLGSSSR